MILLDTSVLSRIFRRRRPGLEDSRVRTAFEALAREHVPLGLPGIVLQEVLGGIRSERQFADLRQRLVSAFDVIHPTTQDYVQAAKLKNKCLARGLNVSGIDCLIATVAIAGNHELFAVDNDFPAIARQAPLRLAAL